MNLLITSEKTLEQQHSLRHGFASRYKKKINTLKVHSIQPPEKPIYKEISQFFGSLYNLADDRVPSMYGSPFFPCYNIMPPHAKAHLSPSLQHFYYPSDSDNYGYPNDRQDLCKESW